MNEKKQSASWYIAATHWLTSGFVVPLILNILISLVLGLVFGGDLKNKITLIAFVSIIFSPLIYWSGVMYSARYINKKYIIKNSNEIANLATIYVLIVGGGYRLFQIIQGSGLTLEHISFILGVIAFYIASKKYIQTSETITQQSI
jgi:hypothetical protein